MIYAASDLHGCSVESFQALLDQAKFSEEDFLYILGDVVDRGEHGAELLSWITQQSNMQLLLGNHEALLLVFRIAVNIINKSANLAMLCFTVDIVQLGTGSTISYTISGLVFFLFAENLQYPPSFL